MVSITWVAGCKREQGGVVATHANTVVGKTIQERPPIHFLYNLSSFARHAQIQHRKTTDTPQCGAREKRRAKRRGKSHSACRTHKFKKKEIFFPVSTSRNGRRWGPSHHVRRRRFPCSRRARRGWICLHSRWGRKCYLGFKSDCWWLYLMGTWQKYTTEFMITNLFFLNIFSSLKSIPPSWKSIVKGDLLPCKYSTFWVLIKVTWNQMHMIDKACNRMPLKRFWPLEKVVI